LGGIGLEPGAQLGEHALGGVEVGAGQAGREPVCGQITVTYS
jgi:hypothetical protein